MAGKVGRKPIGETPMGTLSVRLNSTHAAVLEQYAEGESWSVGMRRILDKFIEYEGGVPAQRSMVRRAVASKPGPKTVLKSIAKSGVKQDVAARPRKPFIPLEVPTHWHGGARIPIGYQPRVEARIASLNAQRRVLYDAGLPYVHVDWVAGSRNL